MELVFHSLRKWDLLRRFKVSSSGSGVLQCDPVSEGLEPLDEVFSESSFVDLIEVIGPEVAVGYAMFQDVIGGDEDGVRDGDDSAFFAAFGGDAFVLGGEVSIFGASGTPGSLCESASQPAATLRGFAGTSFAGTAVVAGAHAGPRSESGCTVELLHAGSYLGDDAFSGVTLDTIDSNEQVDELFERRHEFSDAFIEDEDFALDGLELVHVALKKETMVLVDEAFQRESQLGDLGAESALRKLGERDGVFIAGDHRPDHGATGNP